MAHRTKAVRRAARLLRTSPTLLEFLLEGGGEAFGAGVHTRAKLVARFRRNHRALETLSDVIEHVELARAVLAVPPAVEGVVVECGCYLGGSTVNLSLAAALAGRRLLVFDSFQGLPPPSEADARHPTPFSNWVDVYHEGRFAASLQTVQENVARLGRVDVCDFVPGFFEETMPFLAEPVVCAFLDVDLVDSLKPCLAALWPRLAPGCRLYVHEAQSMKLASVFFDSDWWEETVGEPAPGLIGAGTGLPLAAGVGSLLGYVEKGAAAPETAPTIAPARLARL